MHRVVLLLLLLSAAASAESGTSAPLVPPEAAWVPRKAPAYREALSVEVLDARARVRGPWPDALARTRKHVHERLHTLGIPLQPGSAARLEIFLEQLEQGSRSCARVSGRWIHPDRLPMPTLVVSEQCVPKLPHSMGTPGPSLPELLLGVGLAAAVGPTPSSERWLDEALSDAVTELLSRLGVR